MHKDAACFSRNGSSQLDGRHMARRYPVDWVTRRRFHLTDSRFPATDNSIDGSVRLNPVQPVGGCPKSVNGRMQSSPSDPACIESCCHVTDEQLTRKLPFREKRSAPLRMISIHELLLLEQIRPRQNGNQV